MAVMEMEMATAPNNLGREKLDWGPALWERIDKAVCKEIERARIVTKFLPVSRHHAKARTVPADSIGLQNGTIFVDEGEEIGLAEQSVPFVLTKQQYEAEEALGTGVTLAIRAANRLAQDMDREIFQGGGGRNLVEAAQATGQVIDVQLLKDDLPDGGIDRYGENTFAKVAEAYGLLQNNGHYGPYALVLPAEQYADAHAPLRTTLIMPADRIRPLTDAGFYGTGTLPPKCGLMASIGGNTLDVAIGVDAVTAFVQVDDVDKCRFRLYQRFTVRIKDPQSVVLLAFAEREL